VKRAGVLVLLGHLVSLGGMGCAGAANGQPPPPHASADPRVDTPSELARGPVAIARSRRFHFAVPLPDGAAFTLDEAPPSSYFKATHRPSGSLLYVRKWRLASVATFDACKADLELTLPKELVVDRRRSTELESPELHGPAPFRTRVETFVRVDKPKSADDPGAATGWLFAVGVHTRDCFGFVFGTRATGAEAGSVVGDRLGAISGTSLHRLKFDDAFEGPGPLDKEIPKLGP